MIQTSAMTNQTLPGDSQSNDVQQLAFERFSREMFQNYSINISSIGSPEDNITSHMDLLSFLNRTTSNLTFNASDTQRDLISIILPITVIYVIIFVAGLLGNVITCTVISRNKCMHTATNYYLFNLAISDLLLLLSGMPTDIYKMWYPSLYPFSHSVCLMQGLISETSANATVLTITSFTVERYIAICHPFRQHTMSKLSRAIKFILAIWLLAFCLAAPQAFQFTVVDFADDLKLCTINRTEDDSLLGHAFELSGFVFFVGPMTVICVLYMLIGMKLKKSKLLQGLKRTGSELNGRSWKGQHRVIRMLIAVAVAFFLCWAPHHAQRLLAVYGSTDHAHQSDQFVRAYTYLTYISGVTYFLSTCINPLLYSIMSHKFRDAFKSTISKHCGLKSVYPPNNNHNYSALSRYGGSLKMTNTMSRTGLSDRMQRQESTCSKSESPHPSLRHAVQASHDSNGIRRPQYNRSLSTNSQSTIFTTLSRADTCDTCLNGGGGTKVNALMTESKPNSNGPFTTIAQKLRRGTRKVFQFKTAPIATSAAQVPNDQTVSTIDCKDESSTKKQKGTEIARTNTISNSSLRELDEELSSTELAQFMGEVNDEIRTRQDSQERNISSDNK